MFINQYEIDNYVEPFIIAEIGVNHNGDIKLAKRMIDGAKQAGAHAVKFQTWTKNSLYSEEFLKDKDLFRKGLEEYSLSEKEYKDLADYCYKKDIIFSATPFSEKEVDLLVELEVPFIKVASMDVNNYPFLKYIGEQGLPVILSTGFAHTWEIARAVQTIKDTGNEDIAILHCISDYPPSIEDLNLKNIQYLMDVFDLPVGYSDHSRDIYPCLFAVTQGACIIERHFTLDKGMEGWDHSISSDIFEMSELVQRSSEIPLMLGLYEREISEEEIEKRKGFRRSVVALKDIREGDILTKENIGLKRPGTGIEPEHFEFMLGRKATRNIRKDEIV
jgi:N-acetylneuraminate synthase